jgi:trans-aconitate 2-methyltransferase
MINLAKTTFPTEQNPNLSFKLMDAKNISFQEEFDLAFSNAALHWILDQKTVLKGVQKALKLNGRLLFQMAGKGNAQAVLELFDELMVMLPWRQYFEGFTFPYTFHDPQKYRQLLVAAELEPVRVELVPRDMKFPNPEGMAGWVRTTWLPYTERIPPEMRETFVKEIVSRYLTTHPADSQGVIHLGMMRLEVEAKKC